MTRKPVKQGFTLVELLVVIAIIGILIALLIPAVQAVREAASKVKCKNQIRQMAIAWHHHHDVHKHFPTGGWGWGWVGDVNQGYGKNQPGGWIFNTLPYMEQNNTHSVAGTDAARGDLIESRLSYLNCPSRRQEKVRTNYGHFNAEYRELVAKSDYAANAGSQYRNEIYPGPSSLGQGMDPNYYWPPTNDHTGVCFQRSKLTFASLRAGTSNVLMIGEKYLESRSYQTGLPRADNEHAFSGYNNDIYRTTYFPPLHDRPGYDASTIFGSAHTATLNVAYCDGSVHSISYSISTDVWSNLGNRDVGSLSQEN